MSDIITLAKKIYNNRHFKHGVPFFIVVVGGSFGLQIYAQLKYDYLAEQQTITKTKEFQRLVSNSKPITLEQEYEDHIKKVNKDDWKNIRGPRPWESDNEEYKDLIERRIAESKTQWIHKPNKE